MVKNGTYQINQAKDGYMACCHYCGHPYSDGHIGQVKNYPHDGLVSVYFTCEKCNKESGFPYTPFKPTIDIIEHKLNEKAKTHLHGCGAGFIDCQKGDKLFIVCAGCGHCVYVMDPKEVKLPE